MSFGFGSKSARSPRQYAPHSVWLLRPSAREPHTFLVGSVCSPTRRPQPGRYATASTKFRAVHATRAGGYIYRFLWQIRSLASTICLPLRLVLQLQSVHEGQGVIVCSPTTLPIGRAQPCSAGAPRPEFNAINVSCLAWNIHWPGR